MKRFLFITAALVFSSVVAGQAFAVGKQEDHGRDDRGRQEFGARNDRGHEERGREEHGRDDQGKKDYGWFGHDRDHDHGGRTAARTMIATVTGISAAKSARITTGKASRAGFPKRGSSSNKKALDGERLFIFGRLAAIQRCTVLHFPNR